MSLISKTTGKFGHLGLIPFKNSIISTDIIRYHVSYISVFYQTICFFCFLHCRCTDMKVIMGSPDVNHSHSRFDPASYILPHLSMGFGRLPEVIPHLLIGFIHHLLLLIAHSPSSATAERSKKTFNEEPSSNLVQVVTRTKYLFNLYHINTFRNGTVNVSSSHYLDRKSLIKSHMRYLIS